MKSLKIRLTNVKNKVRESFTDQTDIFGYQGINKDRILESLTESYDLLTTLSTFGDKFETIFAKREVAEAIDQIQEYFNNHINTDEAVDRFNTVLKAVARIRYVLKETYISISDSPLRVDYELAKAKENLESLSSILSEIEEIKSTTETIQSNATTFITELEEKHTISIENEEKISNYVDSISSIEANITGVSEKITAWETAISGINEDIEQKLASVTELQKESEQLYDKSNANDGLIDKQVELLTKQLETNKTHQKQIQDTIEDVSRFGMAGSFKKRKDELKWTQLFWAGMTILSLGGLLYVSYLIMQPLIEGEITDLKVLFYKIPIFASAIWLGWFCSKQYGFNTRIREDYAYKYAISMAFEGFKNETKEVNEELLEKLIELTIFNAARSPERIFNTRSNHGSPYNEMLDSVGRHLFGGKKEETEN